MKTIIVLLVSGLFFLHSFTAKANPIIVEYPQVFISELYFDSGNNWSLELEMFRHEMFPQPGSIDSVVIITNSGRTHLLSFPYDNYTLFLITAENLSNPLVIDPTQDSVKILTYLNESTGYTWFGEYLEHILVFGYPDCEIPVLFPGQSICTWEVFPGYPICFYKDNSPTPGDLNDTFGATATLQGMFYDMLDHLIAYSQTDYDFSVQGNVTSYYSESWQTYYLSLAVFEFDIEGHYSTQILSGRRFTGAVYNLYPDYAPYYTNKQILPCESFNFNLEPGQVVDQNIHLTTGSYIVGLHELPAISQNGLTVVCMPNPFSSYVDIFLSSSTILTDSEIRIFDTGGRLIKTINIESNQSSWTGRVTKDELGETGIYLYSVIEKGNKIKSGQIICQ